MKTSRPKLVIGCTSSETFASILRDLPIFLNQYYEISIISGNSKHDEYLKNYESQGISVYTLNIERKINPLKDIFSLTKILNLFFKIKPDISHSYTPKIGLLMAIASSICFTKHRIHTFTGLIFTRLEGFKKTLMILCDQIVIQLSTIIVAEGKGVEKDLKKISKKENIKVIGNGSIVGVDTNYYATTAVKNKDTYKFKKNIPLSSFYYCYIGRISKDKGFEELIISFQNFSCDAVLLVAGDLDYSDPIDAELLNNAIKSKKIIFLGYQKDIRPLLSISDILVLPSYSEGFPNVLLQAQSMGVPCIATDVNGSNEIILPGYNGWLVKPKSPEALLNAMIDSYRCASLSEYAVNAKKNIENKYTLSSNRQNLVKFYADALN